jgi:hypothetical protein
MAANRTVPRGTRSDPREALHDAAHDDIHAGEHLLHRVRRNVRNTHILETICPGGLHAKASGFMKADRHDDWRSDMLCRHCLPELCTYRR